MLLTIDAGNTNLCFGVFDGETSVVQWRKATAERQTADDYAVWLLQLMKLCGIAREDISAAVISTVVPSALYPLKLLCRRYFHCEPLVIGEPDVALGVQALVDRPEEVGADRLINALSGYRRYGGSLIIVDFGTATTFDVVNAEGNYIGGVIAPGIGLSMAALHQGAAKLPMVEVEHPGKVIGISTVSAMKSGLFWGYMGLVEGIIRRIQSEYGGPMKTIATGGLGALFTTHSPDISVYDADLTMEGLRVVYTMNHKAEEALP